MRKRRNLLHLLALFFATLMPSYSDAQDTAISSIDGEVADSLGAGLADVNVSAIKQGAVPLLTAKTDGTGAFRLDLTPGTYTLEFSAVGFKKTDFEHVAVRGGEKLHINIALEAGPEDELVQREWVIATATPDPGDPESGEQAPVADVPLASRNFTQAAGLASGVSSQVSNATAMGMNSQGVQVGSGVTSNYVFDGAPVAIKTGESDAPAAPNPDAIESNQVQSWTYSAGPERYSGANINVTTKSGTSAFHGTAFEFVRNDIFNANDFFLNRNGSPRPVLKQNQFGFTFGGPISKERVFFFLAYQGTRQSNGFASAGYAPSATLPPIPATRTAATLGPVFCPENHPGDSRYTTLRMSVQVACNGSNINPVAVNLLNLKLPNGEYFIPGSTNGTFQTVPRSIPATFREDQVVFNTDFVLSKKHRLVQKYFYAHDPQLSPFSGGSTALPGSPIKLVTGNIYAVLKLASTFSPAFFNEFRVSGQRDESNKTPQVAFTNDQVGIASIVPAINLIDVINVSGLFRIGGNNNWDSDRINQYQAADDVTWSHGRHSMHFGIAVERRQWNTTVQSFARGLLQIQRFADFLLGLPGCPPGNTTCSVSNPVVNGVMTNGGSFSNIDGSLGPNGNANVTSPNGVVHSYRYSDASGYFQDSFRITPRFTVSAGLRWDYVGLPADSRGENTNFWTSRITPWTLPPSSGTYEGYVVPSNFQGTLPEGVFRNSRRTTLPGGSALTNFAPRVGFSWQPLNRSSLLVRGGYGIFYDRFFPYDLQRQSLAQVPYAVPVGGRGQANYQASLAHPYPQEPLGWGKPRSVNMATGVTSNLNIFLLEENLPAPQTQKWNFEIQHELPWSMMLDVAYAGAHSIHLQVASRQINVPEIATPSHPVYGTITTSTDSNAALRVPYLGFAPTGVNTQQTQGSAKYNALQATLMKRASHGFRFQVSYMFSKTLTTLGAAPSLTGGNGGTAETGMNSNNPLDARQQYGPSPVTSPQRLALNYGWDLPWKTHGFAGKLLNGWGFSGSTIIKSGQPMTLSDSRGGTVYGNAGIARAQYCPGMGAANVPSPGAVKDRLDSYFNKSAICSPPIVEGGTGYGNSSVGIVLGPGQANTDLSVSRGIELKGSKLDLRAQFFNAFNHPQFDQPDIQVSNSNFGRITSTSVNPRLIQFGFRFTF